MDLLVNYRWGRVLKCIIEVGKELGGKHNEWIIIFSIPVSCFVINRRTKMATIIVFSILSYHFKTEKKKTKQL